MDRSNWVKPALGGALAGVVATVAFGFSVGGWMTQGGSERLIASRTSEGVAMALMPYCIEKSRNDPAVVNILAEFRAASNYSRRTLIEKTGWATPLGEKQPNPALATACANELAEAR
ncbi:hypothetical protein Brsp05_03522 [Brucella sp. NBRC 12953]|uniref:hypothetical protein n=1 Tax=Brucella sp. NBRC 12953 TaxID=3075481 RepID=UPI000DE4BE98